LVIRTVMTLALRCRSSHQEESISSSAPLRMLRTFFLLAQPPLLARRGDAVAEFKLRHYPI
jgi:hypothetical protein